LALGIFIPIAITQGTWSEVGFTRGNTNVEG
jgi:hypothetical protein